jgi:D-xylose transport system substrate-binding protein
MNVLKPLGASGKGKVAAILPDTTSSTRYVEFDQPMLKKALLAAGVPASDIIIQNAGGSDSTFYTDAQSDITNGASIILSDPEDSGTGAKVESYAAAHGAKVIDYDRLTLGGSRPYYVSFNNVTVGKVMGQGLVSCVAAWGVKHPNVIFMRGDPTDNNATLFHEGSAQVLTPLFTSKKWTLVATPAGTWTPTTAQSEFEQAFTANSSANAALIPNDENGAPIITYLKSKGVKPKTFPVTGQDATLTGLQNILSGYQCGTVYKPIFQEASAAAALAVYLRAGKTPPSSLLNGTTQDIQEHKAVPSVLLQPEWVTTKNMNATIIHDNFVPAKQLCAGSYAAECKTAGITP